MRIQWLVTEWLACSYVCTGFDGPAIACRAHRGDDGAGPALPRIAWLPTNPWCPCDVFHVHVAAQVTTAPPSRAVRLEAMLVLGRLAARNRACQQDAVREGVVPVLVEMMMDGELTTPGAVCCLFRHWVGVVLCTFCNVPPTVQGQREMDGAFQSQRQTVVFALLCVPRVHLPHTLRVCPLIMCHSGNCRLSVFKVYFFWICQAGRTPHWLALHKSVQSPRLPGAGG